jgi:hypothetical protein
MTQTDEQPSSLRTLPSSQVSELLGWMKLSPQAGASQEFVQVSVLSRLPSSHVSFACWMPSPQTSIRQVAEQPSSLVLFPSSQVSLRPA